MKLRKYFLFLCFSFTIQTIFAQNLDKELYNFSTPLVETKSVKTNLNTSAKQDDILESKVGEVENIQKEEGQGSKDSEVIADAQTFIFDKLIQKYQVRLDEVMDRLATKLETVSADGQKNALKNLRKTIADRKVFVLEKKDLEPEKRDLIVTILDHVIARVDALSKNPLPSAIEKKQSK